MKEKQMKILIIGNGAYSFYEDALCEAVRAIGYEEVELFKYKEYVTEPLNKNLKGLNNILSKVQDKFNIGPGIKKLNKELIRKCKKNRPDLVFLYRCRAVFPGTIKAIKKMGIIVFSYNNDNPFSDYYPKYFWRYYKGGIRYCDINYVYRKSNIVNCIDYGSKKTEILRSYYIESRNFPINNEEKINDFPEVVFLGHYENDGRLEWIKALADSGVIIGLPFAWKEKILSDNIVFLEDTGNKYNLMLNSAKIALVFLSTLNQDTYTRRCFEIPATRTMMLSIYTDDLATLFKSEKEAVYFNSKETLIEKVKYYLDNDEAREKIGNAGFSRLVKDGHEVKDRAKQIIDDYYKIKNNR